MSKQTCVTCEYYCAGICNAAKSDGLFIDKPVDENDCKDWEQVDNNAREQRNNALQERVTIEDSSSLLSSSFESRRMDVLIIDDPINPSPAFNPAILARFREVLMSDYNNFVNSRSFQLLSRDEVDLQANKAKLDEYGKTIREQIDFIKNFFKVDPIYLMANPQTLHEIETIQYPLYAATNYIKCFYDLEPQPCASMPPGLLNVVFPVADVMCKIEDTQHKC